MYSAIINIKIDNKYLIEYIINSINFNNLNPSNMFMIIELFDYYRKFITLRNYNLFKFNNIDDKLINKINESDNLPETLAKFIDLNILKIVQNKDLEDSLMHIICKTIYVLKICDIKHINKFIDYMNKYLSYRILSNKTTKHINIEKQLIDTLDNLFNVSTMYKIIDEHYSNIKNYKNYLNLKVDIISLKYNNVNFHRKAFNPCVYNANLHSTLNNNEIHFNLPSKAEIYTNSYQKLFEGSYINKKLIWKYDTGKVKISFQGIDQKYNLLMSTVQMIVLLMIEEKNNISFDELQIIINIDESLLKFILNSLLKITLISLNNHKYKINNEFIFDHNNINCIKYMKNCPPIKHNHVIKKKVYTFEDKKYVMIKWLLELFKHTNSVSGNFIKEYMNNLLLDFKFNDNELNTVIIFLLEYNIIKINSDMTYTFIDSSDKIEDSEMEDSDSDIG
jgi:hypothetical protein